MNPFSRGRPAEPGRQPMPAVPHVPAQLTNPAVGAQQSAPATAAKTPAWVLPSADDLRQITLQIWGSYLDPDGARPLVPVGPSEHVPGVAGGGLCASISISGAWHGHVAVECATGTGREAAAALMAMDVAEVTAEDVLDALGELANIIGGNIKSTLRVHCTVSLPDVVVAEAGDARWPGATRVCSLVARWLGQPIVVSVWQAQDEYAMGHR